jgi:hypothetical protein
MDFNEYCGAYKQTVEISKTASVTTVAGQWSTLFAQGGFPAAGSAPANTTTGVVPTDATTGFPIIQPFQGSNVGRIGRVEADSPVNQVLSLYDVLFWAGPTTIPTAGTTTVALSSRPSFAARLPFRGDGVTRDWSSVELWAWMSTAGGAQAHTVSADYTNQDGTTARNTGNQSTNGIIQHRLIRMPWAAGDNGARELEGYKVNGIASATGAVVMMAMRRLWRGRVIGNTTLVAGPDMTGLPQVFSDSALMLLSRPESTASSTPSVYIEIGEGT